MPARLTIEDMCKLATVRGGKCLSLEYIGSKAKLQWQCAKGHTWQATPSSVKTKTWCPDCAGVVRLTIDQMRKTAKVRDGECLSQKYLGALVKLEWLCSAGHKWWATPNSVKNGTWCLICSGKAPITIEELQIIAQNKGGEFLSPKIVNSKTNLKWKCAKGHTWLATPNSVKNGTWCLICSGNAPFTIEELQVIAKDRGGECLSKKYSYNKNLQWKCTEGHTWLATAKSVRSGRWCKICQNKLGGEKQRLKRDEFLSRALATHESLYEFDLTTFKGRLKQIDIMCKVHGKFSQKAQDHLSGNGCPFCFTKGEGELKKIIEGLGLVFETQKRIKKRRYDFYLCDHHLLIERDGEQHYREAWEGSEGLLKQKEIDAEKTKLALDHGYKIARIPYWVKNKDEILIELDNIFAGNPTFPLIPDIEQSKVKPKPNGC